MQNSRSSPQGLSGEGAHGRNSESQNLYRTVPRHHNLRGFKAVMHEVLGVGVIKTLTGLARDVLQIPNGKPFFAGEHSGYTVALDIFQRGAENSVDFFGAVEHGNIVTIENLAGGCLVQKVF